MSEGAAHATRIFAGVGPITVGNMTLPHGTFATGNEARPLRIGVFSPRFVLFDAAMPLEFPEGRRRYAEVAARTLEALGVVDAPGLVESEQDARRIGERWATDPVDVVVCWPTMAAPPAWLELVLDMCSSVPVVVVAAQESAVVPDDYDTDQATARSLPVGAVMATNVLRRRRELFETVVGVMDDELVSSIGRAIDVVVTAQRIRRLRLGVVGAAIEGYTDVMASPDQLAQLGVTLVDIADELDAAFLAGAEDDVESIVDELELIGRVEVDAPTLRRSSRLAVALDAVVDRQGLDGGAVNCHGSRLRFGQTIGITACLAVSRCSAAGRPFACTGDVPAAIALCLGRLIAGSALYCELYQLDHERNWALVANGGEGDWSMRDPQEALRFLPEDHYRGERGPGVASVFAIPAGAATLVSLSPAIGPSGGWGLVLAEGDVIDSRHSTMEGPNAMFRFAGLDVADGYRRWCQLGATHHAALLPGHQTETLTRVAEHLAIDILDVAERHDARRGG